MFKRIMWVLNILAVLAFVLSFSASWISPEKIWWIALFGLGYEILFVINFSFFIYWIFLRNKKYILSLLFIILGTSKIFGIVQLNFSSGDETVLKDNGYLKVMTFNVRLFDLYNWFHNSETRQKIFEFLQQESPDIICIQEFYSSDKKNSTFRNDDTLHYYLNAAFAHLEYTVNLHESEHWGIATYSKYPIIKKQAKHFAKRGGNIFISSDIKIGKDTIRVINTHLESIHFGWSDYKFIANLNNDDVEQDEIKGSLTIIRRLRKAFIKRATQVDVLNDSIEASPYPLIVCGDFNDTPSSYTYSILSDHLDDAFRKSGNGSGKTYAGPFPSFRIDYIFHDRRFRSSAYRTIKEKLSDHYPVSCLVKLK
jgi:endonuclease/exonuclease/phosphatase family metal-dependent hydrolase